MCVCVCGQETRLRWEKAYRSVPSANKGGNMRETAAFRKSATGSEKVRRACWSALLDIEATQRIPSKYQDKWRVDPWGNVVSIHASAMSSVCGFQVDHVSESGRKSREGRVCLTRPLWFDTSHYACPFLFFCLCKYPTDTYSKNQYARAHTMPPPYHPDSDFPLEPGRPQRHGQLCRCALVCQRAHKARQDPRKYDPCCS